MDASLCCFHPLQSIAQFSSHESAIEQTVDTFEGMMMHSNIRDGLFRDDAARGKQSLKQKQQQQRTDGVQRNKRASKTTMSSSDVGFYRSIEGLAKELLRTLTPDRHAFFSSPVPTLRSHLDTRWCMKLSQEQWESCLSNIECDALVLTGECSHWCTPAGLEAIVKIMGEEEFETETTRLGNENEALDRRRRKRRKNRRSCIAGASHWVMADNPSDVSHELYSFIDNLFNSYHSSTASISATHAQSENCCRSSQGDDRRAEVLGIRPLDQFQSLEDAKRRLGPRPIPSSNAIRRALKQLKAEERYGGTLADGVITQDIIDSISDDEDDYIDKRVTKLAKDDPEYFGYVT